MRLKALRRLGVRDRRRDRFELDAVSPKKLITVVDLQLRRGSGWRPAFVQGQMDGEPCDTWKVEIDGLFGVLVVEDDACL